MSHVSKIVVAEDDPLIRESVVEALADAGFAVIDAEDARGALAAIEPDGDDVEALFTDVQMPGPMDGVQLAQHVHARWPWIKLLVASGRSTPNSLPRGSRFLSKPYQLSRVVKHVRELTS